jgi:hypothetical protein
MGIGFESSRKKPTVARKTKKHSFDQMGLSFSGELDGNEDFDESRTNEKSDPTDMQFVQKSMQRGSETASGSAYLDN